MKYLVTHKVAAAALTVVLLLSCAGGSIGMALHSMDMSMSQDHAAVDMHACCGVDAAFQSGAMNSTNTSLDHHAPSVILAEALAVVFVVLLLMVRAVARIRIIPSAIRVVQRIQLALQEIIQFFTKTFLFSRGILHSKTW